MSIISRLPVNRIGSAILAVGTIAFAIGIISGGLDVLANPFIFFTMINVVGLLIYPTVALLLCIGVSFTRNLALRITFLLVAVIAVPLLLKRDGGGVTDVSEIVKIRSAQYFYAAATLRDVSTILWVACATSALWLLRKPRRT